MVQPQDDVVAILSPHLEIIRQCISSAWEDYMRECNSIRHKTTPRSRASIVHDNMVFNAKALFDDVTGVRYLDNKGLFLLIFDERIRLRFKKLDEDKMPHNIPTQQTMSFLEQMDLPGIPQATNIIAGYELNSLQTEISTICLTCPNGSSNAWCIELMPTSADVIELSSSPVVHDGAVEIKIKDIQEREEQDGAN